MLTDLQTETIYIYFATLVALMLTAFIIVVFLKEYLRQRRPDTKKQFLVYYVYRGEKRYYFALDFYNPKRPWMYQEHVFSSAFEAFQTTKQRQDFGDYDVLLLTREEADLKLAQLNEQYAKHRRRTKNTKQRGGNHVL